MDNRTDPTPEEMEKLLEKAKNDLQAMLDKMTPEERELAAAKAQKMIEEDQASMQAIMDSAAKVLSDTEPKRAPKFCPNCGAPVSGGEFCTYCGSRAGKQP